MATDNHTDLATAGAAAVFYHVTVPDGELDAAIGDRTTLTTTEKGSLVGAINEVFTSVAGLLGGSFVTAQTLKQWTEAESYEATSITRNSDGVVTTATVKWPDGSAGTFTTDAINATWVGIDAYHITHAASGKTVTQAAYTRNSDGDVITKPPLTVS